MMNSLLFVSQLLIPTIPAGVTADNFIQETIKTYSCVSAVEEDGVVHTLDQSTGTDKVTKTLIVSVKSKKQTAACAKTLAKEIDGLKIESVLKSVSMIIVSYEVPTDLEGSLPAPKEDDVVSCLSIDGICPQ